MRTRIAGALAAGFALAAGAPWWGALAAGLAFQIPGRLAPALGAVGVLAALVPVGIAEPWRDVLSLLAGVLAGWAALWRLAPTVPWVALPYVLGGTLALSFAWEALPPAGLWTRSDLAVRARIVALAGLAMLAAAPTYLPRYRNVPGSSSVDGGTSGGRDETR